MGYATKLLSPPNGDPEKARVAYPYGCLPTMGPITGGFLWPYSFLPILCPGEGRVYVSIWMSPHYGDPKKAGFL